MRATLIATALLFSSLAQADEAKAQPYTYGTQLDVASVLSVKIKPTPYCEVTDAVMTYRDSAGAERKLAYRTLSEACKYQN
ncbi:DUF2790 domain-containing protein [Stutzerimonas decontaminans]|uniref:DUF2790 domain-containing protein n=2 Tax=Stutzerimonas TaxID=2901164 RepID=A0ABX4VXY6_9GAMM|nr:DUF2790 domain-containing protein [Stutzerimonas decontaminans]AHY44676.1 hypothetical protein UIB01_20225 [Stutzerimonas decontaminans]MCQ4243605.1 DUF2790 domain-containing protein [Stutzerimonas decontaminans]PNF84116.1 DUF2790 domain-containing protein [Stutzerimonas decontaminans]